MVFDRLPFVHDDLDAHVPRRIRPDAPRASVRVVIAARAVKALDAREIALEDRVVVDFVVEDDAAEETEELGALRRGEHVLEVGGGDL